MSHILHVVGARPNFMKAAPVIAALSRFCNARQTLVHTGQHYDANMSDIFFEQLDLPRPDISLEIGSGPHGAQTGQIMHRFEEVLLQQQPDLVLVYGDVNSTMAAALVCAKLPIKLGHVEAGLRSHDRSMPEEINRIVTDQLSDILFTPSADGDANLLREGIRAEKMHCVGNVMIDTLKRLLPQARRPKLPAISEKYALVTLHRPSNVDDPEIFGRILRTLAELSEQLQIVFPIHPRTRNKLAEHPQAVFDPQRVLLLEPVGYLEFLALEQHATVVVTDSGGVQEETTWLRVPCLTLRENTERPITVEVGTNILIGSDMDRLHQEVDRILTGVTTLSRIPPLWDGRAAERIADVIAELVLDQTSEVRSKPRLAA
jgi:UDP-N-acetylglucosamine 2-epimerase (non-hydrolysing)